MNMGALIEYQLHPDVFAFTAGREVELPCPVVQMHQVHEVMVARVDAPDMTREQLDGYDALVTNVPGVCIGARSADCIPVLLYDPVRRASAAIHSGWRGTVTRVCRKAITKMKLEYGSEASDMLAIVGPGICADCFQVGEEVALEFRNELFDLEKIWTFNGPRVNGDVTTGHHINLPEACRETLIDCGVLADNIQMSNLCTYERTDILYSARKEGSDCGRNITAIKIL